MAGLAEPLNWAPVQSQPDSKKTEALQWQPLPAKPTQTPRLVWTAIPRPTDPEEAKTVVWQALPPGAPDIEPTTPAVIAQPLLPPAPAIQTFNRSVAFNDRTPGPDVAWKVPQGFRWSENWFIDFSILGASTRPENSNFWAWNNGDATGEIHARVYQGKNWTFGINATFRSVYQGSNFAGGTTQVGDGFATGFRLDYALSDTSGIALGAEQLIQYDSNNDTGRNLYLVGSKGWWLGGRKGGFPLAIGTIGVGTGRFGDNTSYQFGCTNNINSSIDATQSLPLCWSPIASAAFVFNENISLFSEYNSQDIVAGISTSLNNSFPVRLSWGVIVGNKGVDYQYVGNDNLRWFFRASLGF